MSMLRIKIGSQRDGAATPPDGRKADVEKGAQKERAR